MGPLANAREKPTTVTVFLVLGTGFVALFAGVGWFWAIWVLGFAVIVPLVAILSDEETERGEEPEDEPVPADPIERLKQQYAAGELTEAEFERRLERRLADDGEPRDVARRREIE